MPPQPQPEISESARNVAIDEVSEEALEISRVHRRGFHVQRLLDSTTATLREEHLQGICNSAELLLGHRPISEYPLQEVGDLVTKLRTRAESAEAKVAFLEAQWESDKPLPEDAEITEAHPMNSGHHDTYQEAMRLVGARHSKSGLVELVNWLLVNLARLIQERADLSHQIILQPAQKGGDEPCPEHQPLTTRVSNAASPGPIPADAATPLTDAEALDGNSNFVNRPDEVVPADFARTLERELTAERAARLKAEEERDELLHQKQQAESPMFSRRELLADIETVALAVGRAGHWEDCPVIDYFQQKCACTCGYEDIIVLLAKWRKPSDGDAKRGKDENQ